MTNLPQTRDDSSEEYGYLSDEFAEETGLNLFDDSASAAGGFSHAFMGYDKSAVDDYVRSIEKQVSTLMQLSRHLRRELATVQRALGTSDFSRLGAHAQGILRASEAQAKDIVTKSGLEAERIKEEGRRVAADLRANAQSEADDIRVAALGNLRQLREDLDAQITVTLNETREEAASLLAGAQRHAEAVKHQASREAEGILDGARVEAEHIRAEAERGAADVLLNARTKGEEALSDSQQKHAAVLAKTNGMLAESTRHHEASAAQLADEAAEAQQIRTSAINAAEQLKARAARDAENTIAGAHRQAAMMKDRMEEQYAWRKEQLERETNALLQRKASVIAQLSNLRQLAGETPMDFPDDDPFAEVSTASSTSQGDHQLAPDTGSRGADGTDAAVKEEKTSVIVSDSTAAQEAFRRGDTFVESSDEPTTALSTGGTLLESSDEPTTALTTGDTQEIPAVKDEG